MGLKFEVSALGPAQMLLTKYLWSITILFGVIREFV